MPQFYSIRFRLTATFLAIIFAVMVIISLFLYNILERYYMSNFEEGLERSAQLASDFVAGHLRGQIDSVRLSALAENISRQSQARVIFSDQNGFVVGDSLRVGGFLNQYLEHEDLTRALNGEISSSKGYSDRVQSEALQLAVPVYENGGNILGAVFMSASLADIENLLNDIRRFLFISTVIVLAVVGSGSIILARRFTGPLEELTAAARKMAEGKLDQHIEVTSGDEIGRLAEQFNVMAKRLNYYTSNLKKFAADVAHEVRTPLTTLSLLVKALQEHDMEPEQQQEFIDDMDSELERLTLLVNDLLELSKLENAEIDREEVDLSRLLADTVEQNTSRFAGAGLELIYDAGDGPYIISGAPLQLRQVINNLLDNAFSYTPAGGWVAVTVNRAGGEIVVKVEDTGCGIPEEDRNYIFERFYRVDQARSRQLGGTGLGLSIVREIVARHGGRVWVESEVGRGSSFYFALPFEQKKM